jgi:squalene-hopene/tetraprenyl-beta-curcumene cyclase
MGYAGYPLDHPQVNNAVQYIISMQEADGSWYGRWGVNYIYGTWQVLRGLAAMNFDMKLPWVLRARDWLRSVQRPDGGWGERCNTYEDPVFKGAGPSTPSQTAWAVMGLCAVGDLKDPWLHRGLDYLLRTQNEDGSWTEDETTGTGFPCVFYLKYDMYRNTWPLLAIATYRKLLRGQRPGQVV